MGKHSTIEESSDCKEDGDNIRSDGEDNSTASKRSKRRRQSDAPELEVDINANEPPSKKALRKARRKSTSTGEQGEAKADVTSNDDDSAKVSSPWSVWIGNLPWSASKSELKEYLVKTAELLAGQITRVHMPAPAKRTQTGPTTQLKALNKGFAYVDFADETCMLKSIAISERLLHGRRLLIKKADNFDGRPGPEEPKPVQTNKPASLRIFVGNLGFDTNREDLEKHYKQCGDVADVHVATFEDSGKCKGYAWVRFVELGSAEAAVRGHTLRDEDGKSRKWWVNQLDGRSLRVEFAEDSAVRYKKRFGQKTKDDDPVPSSTRRDARTIKPGAALAAAPRQGASIVESQGKKTVFE